MSIYMNILESQTEEFNKMYKQICKEKPHLSIKDKQTSALALMMKNRNLNISNLFNIMNVSFNREFQYTMEVVAMSVDVYKGITRYYLKDDSLFDFFKNTEVRQKDKQSIIDFLDNQENCSFYGVLGKTFTFLLGYLKDNEGRHMISIFTKGMNYTFCVEEFDDVESPNANIYNLGMNFLFYINAFPDCIIDGVPNGVKRNPKGKVISTSDKIVSHTTVEHGFVRPHFRCGYFRHFNSDYFVNCKGQIRFIESTMVKGKAKTVINKE